MPTETFTVEHDAGADVYFRLFDDAGQVFDFDDDTFKALVGATTPYLVATERSDMGGTTISGYQASIDLATVNPAGAAERFTLKAYDNATPADTDEPLDGAAGPQEITVQLSRLVPAGGISPRCGLEAAVRSTAGDFLDVVAWLEHDGVPVDLATVDAAAAIEIAVREKGAGADLFPAITDGAAGPNAAGRFELAQETPGFTDDRLYVFDVTITENGNAHRTLHVLPVHG